MLLRRRPSRLVTVVLLSVVLFAVGIVWGAAAGMGPPSAADVEAGAMVALAALLLAVGSWAVFHRPVMGSVWPSAPEFGQPVLGVGETAIDRLVDVQGQIARSRGWTPCAEWQLDATLLTRLGEVIGPMVQLAARRRIQLLVHTRVPDGGAIGLLFRDWQDAERVVWVSILEVSREDQARLQLGELTEDELLHPRSRQTIEQLLDSLPPVAAAPPPPER